MKWLVLATAVFVSQPTISKGLLSKKVTAILKNPRIFNDIVTRPYHARGYPTQAMQRVHYSKILEEGFAKDAQEAMVLAEKATNGIFNISLEDARNVVARTHGTEGLSKFDKVAEVYKKDPPDYLGDISKLDVAIALSLFDRKTR